MKLTFSAPREHLEIQKERIFAIVSECYPGSFSEIDGASGVLTVELADGVSSDAAAKVLLQRLYQIGVSAKRIECARGAEHVNWYSSPPPIQYNVKKSRSVRLSVFIASLLAVALVFSVLAFAFGAVLSGTLSGGDTLGTGDGQGENYAEQIAVVDYIFKHYGLYDTNGDILLDAMLKAYAAATGDRYAAYYTDEELAAMMADMEGEGVGVGVSVTLDPETGNIMILQVFPGSPAAEAGVLPGDAIVSIGSGESAERVSEIGYDVALQKMLGDVGTTAEFTVLRNGEEISFSILRAVFIALSVDGRVSSSDPTVGIVRISSFDANTPAQFKSAMNALIGNGCTRFVFDVRNNPGGEQKSVMAVLSYFLEEKDIIMSVVSKDGSTTYYKAEAASYNGDYAACSVAKEEIGMYRGYPMVVLTNEYTASAGELFTAGLTDYELATTVGVKTYGKGVIQSIYDLSAMGYSGGLKLTIGYYTGPSCVNYDGVGLEPDLPVMLDESLTGKNLYLLTEEQDNQLSAALAAVLAK